MLDISRLISHRFRGFAEEENTIAGLTAAMSRGVALLEFDIRVTRCGTPLIFHDEFAQDKNGKIRKICDVMAKDLIQIGGRFATMPTAEDLLHAAGLHHNKQARLLIDIKDAGFEAEIHALVMMAGLGNRVTYVSWVPEALYQIHDIAPQAPLCLSHWCQNPDALIRKFHTVHVAKNNSIPKAPSKIIHGERSGYFIDGRLEGELFDIIKMTKGSVCVPQDMVSARLVSAYHGEGIEVSAFSYVDWPSILAANSEMKIDQYFIDDKAVFDRIPH